jgi:hypothetical protein
MKLRSAKNIGPIIVVRLLIVGHVSGGIVLEEALDLSYDRLLMMMMTTTTLKYKVYTNNRRTEDDRKENAQKNKV